jgi:hypothetical protein
MTADPALDQTIEWLGLKFCVRAEWQIVEHGVAPEGGRLVFVDRRRERLDLFWRACSCEPDIERTLEDQRAKELLAHPGTRFEPLSTVGGWKGFRRHTSSGKVVTRAGRYDAADKRWLEAVVIHPPGSPDPVELDLDVLESVTVQEPAESSTRWKAFDIDVTTPTGFRLLRAQARPADITFEFRAFDLQTGESCPGWAIVHRMGMADAWYSGDAEQILVRDNPRVDFSRFLPDVAGPHAAIAAEGRAPGTPLGRLLGRSACRRAIAWHCEPTNAVYCVATTSRAKTPVMPRDFTVTCCQGAHG